MASAVVVQLRHDRRRHGWSQVTLTLPVTSGLTTVGTTLGNGMIFDSSVPTIDRRPVGDRDLHDHLPCRGREHERSVGYVTEPGARLGRPDPQPRPLPCLIRCVMN